MRIEELRRQPLLDHDPLRLERGPHDPALPARRRASPLEQQAGEAAMTVGHPAVLKDGRAVASLPWLRGGGPVMRSCIETRSPRRPIPPAMPMVSNTRSNTAAPGQRTRQGCSLRWCRCLASGDGTLRSPDRSAACEDVRAWAPYFRVTQAALTANVHWRPGPRPPPRPRRSTRPRSCPRARQPNRKAAASEPYAARSTATVRADLRRKSVSGRRTRSSAIFASARSILVCKTTKQVPTTSTTNMTAVAIQPMDGT